MSDSSYRTISRAAEIEQRIKNSRFIGIAGKLRHTDEFPLFVNRMRAEYSAASHHCYAYRIFNGTRVIESTGDDGEPAGSAGLSILRILKGRKLIDVGVVVVRYFGGIKLGIGGLMRAYGGTAALAIEKAGVETYIRKCEALLMFHPSVFGEVNTLIEKFEIERIETGYGSTYSIRIRIPTGAKDLFKEAFANATSGTGVVRYKH